MRVGVDGERAYIRFGSRPIKKKGIKCARMGNERIQFTPEADAARFVV